MTLEDYERLISAGIIDGSVEYLNGRMMWSGFEIGLSPEQMDAARAAGIDLEPHDPRHQLSGPDPPSP